MSRKPERTELDRRADALAARLAGACPRAVVHALFRRLAGSRRVDARAAAAGLPWEHEPLEPLPPQAADAIPEVDPTAPPDFIGSVFERLREPAAGRHYTPAALADELARLTLSGGPDTQVCDPACGCGALLLAARRVDGSARLFGCDLDAGAVEAARLAIALIDGEVRSDRIVWADALSIAAAVAPLPADWVGAFDVVLANPPFVNAIDGGLDSALKSRLASLHPELTATADLASHFVALAHRLAKPEGSVGLIVPRPILSADSAGGLRARLAAERRPRVIRLPDDAAFASADVRIALVVLDGTSRPGDSAGPDWWPAAADGSTAGPTVGDVFEVSAGMTTRLAYAAAAHLVDDPDAVAGRLITAGLVDPNRSRWGELMCRYLGRVLRHPALRDAGDMPPVLRRRLQASRRPKVIVAGVAGPGDRLEAFVDADGSCCGAVSTVVVAHPADDIKALILLCEYLNSTDASAELGRRRGATAMGGGLLTVGKRFVRGLAWTKE